MNKLEADNYNYNNVSQMNNTQLSRWLALYEAINIVADKAESSGKKFNVTCMKQPAIEEYIESTYSLIFRELERNV